MKKEFGDLTREEIRQVFAGLIELREEQEEFYKLVSETDKVDAFIEPWFELYELSFISCLALFVCCAGMQEVVGEAARSENPQGAALDLLDTFEVEGTPDDEEKAIFIALLMALTGQVEAFSQYSQPMSDLIVKAREGDQEALFRAITIDRTVIGCPTIMKQISLAQVKRDEAFMNRLAKAITRTKPARPKPHYDDFRFMLEALVEKVGVDSFTSSQFEDILQHDLELYTNDSDYSNRALRKLIQKRNQMVEPETAI